MSFKLKIAVYTTLVIIVISVIIALIILPTVQEIRQISVSIYNERIDLEKKYLKGQLLKKTIADFEEIEPQKEKLESIFIIESEELEFISTLENVSSISGVKQVIELKTKDIQEKNNIKTYPLKITASGDFNQIMKYITSLEGLDYYLNIDYLKIVSDQNSLMATLTGNAFAKVKTE